MKAVAYSIQSFEKEFLAKANFKKHDITLISNYLSLSTVMYAEGKEAVIVYCEDVLSEEILIRLLSYGVSYIIMLSENAVINKGEGSKISGLQIAFLSGHTDAMAKFTTATLKRKAAYIIDTLDRWQMIRIELSTKSKLIGV
jgi:D-lactate dehydrogenase